MLPPEDEDGFSDDFSLRQFDYFAIIIFLCVMVFGTVGFLIVEIQN